MVESHKAVLLRFIFISRKPTPVLSSHQRRGLYNPWPVPWHEDAQEPGSKNFSMSLLMTGAGTWSLFQKSMMCFSLRAILVRCYEMIRGLINTRCLAPNKEILRCLLIKIRFLSHTKEMLTCFLLHLFIYFYLITPNVLLWYSDGQRCIIHN